MSFDRDLYDEAVCPRCGRRIEQGRVARYEHQHCEARPIDKKRQREAIRRAYEAAATYLTREGHPEEAAKLFDRIAAAVHETVESRS